MIDDIEKDLLRALSNLSDTSMKYVQLKYGLNPNRRHTQPELQKAMGGKKRQLEALENRAIRNLRKPKIWKSLEPHLDWADACAWSVISQKVGDIGEFVPKKNIIETLEDEASQIPGAATLLLCLYYGNLHEWIHKATNDAPRAWFRTRYCPQTVEKALATLQAALNVSSNLALLEAVIEKLDNDEQRLQLVMHLTELDVAISGKFLFVRPLTSIALRAIRFYLILYHKYPHRSVTIDNLINDFNETYVDDKANHDICERVLKKYPHLFGMRSDSTWATAYSPLPDARQNETHISRNRSSHSSMDYFERPWDEMPLRFFLTEIVEYKGIASFLEIENEFITRTGGKFHKSTMGQAMRSEEAIVEVAPNLYSVWENNTREYPREKYYHLLLNRRACIKFITHRFAGEPLDAYPMWTPDMEYRWCCWADNESYTNTKIGFGDRSDIPFKRKILQSLLAVVDLEKWTVSEEEKKHWIFKKQWIGNNFFAHDLQKANLSLEKFPLQDLFSVSVLARELGYINWIRASSDLFSHHSISKTVPVLMALVLLKILRPPCHWQQKHDLGDGIDDAIDAMSLEIKKKGFVHWCDDAGIEMRRRMKENMKTATLGWVASTDAEALLNAIEGTQRQSPPEKINLDEKAKKTPKQMMLPF